MTIVFTRVSDAWIGLRHHLVLRWSDGRPLAEKSYTNWKDNPLVVKEDKYCVRLHEHTVYKWEFNSCDKPLFAACQYDTIGPNCTFLNSTKKCYNVTKVKATWEVANSTCHLAVIESTTVQTLIDTFSIR